MFKQKHFQFKAKQSAIIKQFKLSRTPKRYTIITSYSLYQNCATEIDLSKYGCFVESKKRTKVFMQIGSPHHCSLLWKQHTHLLLSYGIWFLKTHILKHIFFLAYLENNKGLDYSIFFHFSHIKTILKALIWMTSFK